VKASKLMMPSTLTGISLLQPRNEYKIPKPDKEVIKEQKRRNKL
jgi:hypothetical protein